MDDDLGVFDLDDEREDDLLDYQQDGPGLFDEPLADPEPACDIAAQNQVVTPEEREADPIEPDDVAAPTARPIPDPATISRPAAPLALYRRYRPDTFAEVIGQEHVTEPLSRAIANNKVNHAYLFSGPRGCGKTTSARILARCLNCAEGPTPVPCGVCDSCVSLATGGPGSIDVIEIDAASHGRVDDARELREGVYFAPVSNRYKIYIIDEAHMVTKEGFNALLKVVEEPPEHVKFIFATTEPEKVIGTIRSRTHHYPFRLVPPRTLTGYLDRICTEEGVRVERGVLPLVVRAGAGSVRDALSVLDQLLGAAGEQGVDYAHAAALLGYTPDALLDEIVDAFAAGDGSGVFATIDKVIEVGQDPRRFAEDLLERMRDLVIVAQVPDALTSGLIDVADDQGERLTSQAHALGAGELTRAAEVIASGLVQMRGTTAPRLHLELICARVLLPTADQDGRGLHARLDRLERRLDMPDVVPGRSVQQAAWSPDDLQPADVDVAAPPPAAPPRQRSAAEPEPEVDPPTTAAAGQRPAGQRPARQRPVNRQPAPQPPAPRASDDLPESTPQHGGSGVQTADVRRLWPQILEEVKSRKRFSHALISQNAHVVEVRGRALLLGFANQGTLDRFNGGGSPDVLRDSIVEVMGADLHIEAAVDGGPVQSGPAPRPGPAAAAPAEERVGRPNRARQRPASGGRVGGGQQRPAQPPREPEDEPEPPYDDQLDAADRVNGGDQIDTDDPIVDDGVAAAELLVNRLGAQLIEEHEN